MEFAFILIGVFLGYGIGAYFRTARKDTHNDSNPRDPGQDTQ